MSSDKTERLLNLTAALLSTDTGLTAADVRARVHGYPQAEDAFHRAFERDKDDLRELGLPLRAIDIEAAGDDRYRYLIPRDEYELDVVLDNDELAALTLARHAIQGDGFDDRSGLWSLGGLPGEPGVDNPVLSDAPASPHLAELFAAVAGGKSVAFAYGGRRRVVVAPRLLYRGGRWYCNGFDQSRQEDRSFRLDRIDGAVDVVVVAEGDDTSPPEPSRPSGPSPTDEAAVIEVELLVDDEALTPVKAALPMAGVGEAIDGRHLVRTAVVDWPRFRGFLMSYLGHVLVQSPDDRRRDVQTWLRQCREPRPVPEGPWPEPAAAADAPTRRQRTTAADRVRRILAIVPWIAAHPGVSVAETCRRFEINESELSADLSLVWMVGVYPYTPDTLIDVDMENGHLSVTLGDYFRRPMRLTQAQAVPLLLGARLLLSIPGSEPDGALARAEAKLAEALSLQAADRVTIDLDPVDETVLNTVRAAVEDGHQLDVEYYTYGRDTVTQRRVDPWTVFNDSGHFYLNGFCHLAHGARNFRLDRMRGVTPTTSAIEHAAPKVPPSVDLSDGLPMVRVVLTRENRWVADSYAVAAWRALDDGSLDVVLPVAGDAWFERLWLRLGPMTAMDGPAEVLALGPAAADRILAAYA